MPNPVARFLGSPPRTVGQWVLLILATTLPAAGYFAASYYERHPQGWIDLRPGISLLAAWAAAVVAGLIGLWRRVRWVLPAFALNLILLASGVIAPRFINPAPILWGERGVYQFSVLSDNVLLVCGAEWVRLDPDAAFEQSLHQSCGFADVVKPFPDGRVILGIYDRPMFGDRAGRFQLVESLPENLRILRGAVATPDGGSILVTVSIPGGGVRFSKYKADGSLNRFWMLQPPENQWSAAPLAWSVAPYPDGSAAVLWRDPNKIELNAIAWHDPEGRLLPDTVVRDFCATCVDPQLHPGRDGSVYVIGSGKSEFSVLHFSRRGNPDSSFHPDDQAILEALKYVQSMAVLPEGGMLIGGQKKVLRLDDVGQIDGSFSCALENSGRGLGIQGDRFLVLDGDRLRRFHRDGSPDGSWRMPRLSTRLVGPSTTLAK